MVRRFRPPVLPTTRTWASAVAGLILAVATAVAAEPGTVSSLKPYTAQYETTARGISLTLDRHLKTDGRGNYTLTNGGKILVVGFYEVSVFRIEDAQIVPKSYVYQGTGLINRRREVHFTPGAATLRSLYKGDWYELPYTDGTLDRMSQQEQIRLYLLNDPTPRGNVPIRIADGRKVKDYQLVYVGEEALNTPLGRVNTLHFKREHEDPERKSDLWLAPAWDYMMVKTVHIEDGQPVHVNLTSASIDGVPVAAARQAASAN
jgi:Protein of unknown function (DUF3108)